MWQDWVMSVGQIVFCVALIPSLRSRSKPDLKTSVLTFLVLFTYLPAQWSLGLYWASAFTLILGIEWLLLAWQTWTIQMTVQVSKVVDLAG